MLVPRFLLPISLTALVAARLHHSLVPEDPFAFPKYRVTFLNGLPVLNETAQRWFQNGLKGGNIDNNKLIYGHCAQPDASHISTPHLELLKLGPRASYACLIPPPPEEVASPVADEPSTDVTPGHTWSLLQPLAGTCLYHRQGWFTYAYCHNSHVRQFHELANPQAQRLGEYRPEEDTEWEAYTLGRAPPTLDPGADLTVAEEAALAANVELARGPGSRYLVQRWGDGTYCEKTGRKREAEIQFHCSMTMTDTILFVKETQTCHYVIHIATPRLCGEPGFRSRLDAREESFIRCREILNADAYEAADRTLPAADHPFKMPRKLKPTTIAPSPPAEEKDGKQQSVKKTQHDLIRRALERLIGGGELKAGEVFIEPLGEGDDEVIIEFIEADLEGDESADKKSVQEKAHPSIEQALRAAGYNIKGEKKKKDDKSKTEGQDGKQRRAAATGREPRDEL
ncbi:unnamed protein product [Somion occarium]|uniref:Protein OS-9 homolog n=1 Tax=Somion occarium TaxID=3059160 RepID=A0ABP1D932_9APHY